MKKVVSGTLAVLLISFFFTQCKKDEKFTVYGPPNATINFSDVSDLIIDSTGKTITIKAKVTSSNGLQKVEVLYQPWNIAKSITTFTDNKNFLLSEAVVIPLNAALQVHSLTVKATDANGNVNSTEIKVGLQDLNYSKLYMADITDPALLLSDLFGVPMLMNKTGAHVYDIIYYARTNNVNLKFLPSKTAFTPVALGIDPANSQKLITSAATSLPVVLPTKGYYKITINTLLLTYVVEKTAATGTPFAQVAFAGRGFYDVPNMNYQNTLPNIVLLDKDPDNPFLFTKSVRMGIPPGRTYTTAQFIFTTNNGWTNFWRFDNTAEPELAVFNGGSDGSFPITSTPVTYLFIFDTFTRRVQAIKQL
jgi:hypothetical protein